MNFSTTPPCASILTRAISAYADSIRSTSSGSACSDAAVNPTRSQNTTDTTFRPGLDVPEGTLTVAQGRDEISTAADVRRGYRAHGAIGHSGALQTASRLARRQIGPDGTIYAAGTAIPQRADFNTLDNPFAWSATGVESVDPAAGVHFVVFTPTSDDFHRVRNAMDGVLPDGTTLPFDPGAEGQGFNSVLRTTRRQNFLVPPRARRSFPLSELRS